MFGSGVGHVRKSPLEPGYGGRICPGQRSDMSGKTHWNPASRPDMSGLTGDFGGRLISIICTSPTHSGIPFELQWRKKGKDDFAQVP
jgi:hypothetical protein